jgi:amidase
VLDVDTALDITRRCWRRSNLTGAEVDRLLGDWDRERVRAMRLLDRFDAILSPAAPEPARPLGHADDTDWTFTLPPSLWGWPAAVVRGAWADTEPLLPVGVQLVAGPWQERTCIDLAGLVEAAAR